MPSSPMKTAEEVDEPASISSEENGEDVAKHVGTFLSLVLAADIDNGMERKAV
jgi:hypothetical protein